MRQNVVIIHRWEISESMIIKSLAILLIGFHYAKTSTSWWAINSVDFFSSALGDKHYFVNFFLRHQKMCGSKKPSQYFRRDECLFCFFVSNNECLRSSMHPNPIQAFTLHKIVFFVELVFVSTVSLNAISEKISVGRLLFLKWNQAPLLKGWLFSNAVMWVWFQDIAQTGF